jgi:organic radical activating enzyme
MYNLNPLTNALQKQGFRTHIETSGAHPVTGQWDWICLSPKKFKCPLEETHPLANELKVIIYNKSDFKWAETYAAKVSPNCQLFLQPEYSRFDQVMPSIVQYVKEFPKWKISLQIHKYMDIP